MEKIIYDGSVTDQKRNPVFALLLEYKKMRKNEIISHIHSWWFDVDGNQIFNQAKDSNLIIQSEHEEWSLTTNKKK